MENIIMFFFSQYYWKNDVPIEGKTTYKLSYWEGETCPSVRPILPENSLTVGDGPMTDETTHRVKNL